MDEQINKPRFFRSGEELFSMFLGLAIVLVVFILVINFFQRRKGNIDVPGVSDTSIVSQKVTPTPGKQKGNVAVVKDKTVVTPVVKPTKVPKPTSKPLPTVKIENTKTLEPTRVLVIPVKTTADKENKVSEYTVVRGDSLWKIAAKELGSGYLWVEIKKSNHLINPGKLAVGQNLILPAGNKEVIIQGKRSNPIEGGEYTVVRDDSLSKIALRAYGDSFAWTKIWQANKKMIQNPNVIRVGWKLVIPR